MPPDERALHTQPMNAPVVHEGLQRKAEMNKAMAELAKYDRAKEFARRFRGADEWSNEDDIYECQEFAAEAVAAATPGIVRAARIEALEWAWDLRRHNQPCACYYCETTKAEITRLKAEGGSK